jgi:hypothetical protein
VQLLIFFILFKALKSEMIPFLVGLLETGLEMQENPAATKAQIVKAIKAMQQSLKHGDAVSYLFCCWLVMSLNLDCLRLQIENHFIAQHLDLDVVKEAVEIVNS